MMEPKSVQEFNQILNEYFSAPKLLVFLSDSIEISKEFEKGLEVEEILEEFDDSEIIVIKIKESKDLTQIFTQYDVSEVPTSIFLNSNLSALKVLKNLSPMQLLDELEKCGDILETNNDLEREKYQKIFKRNLRNNKLILFEFSQKYNSDYDQVKKYIEDNGFSYKNITNANCKENNSLVILCQFNKFIRDEYSFDLKQPTVLFLNKNLIKNFKKAKELIEIHRDLLENLKKEDISKFNQLVQGTPILLIINKGVANWEEQNQIMKKMENSKVIFSYLDLNERQNLSETINNLVESPFSFPILKNSETKYFSKKGLGENFIQDLIHKDYIAESIDSLIKYLIASQRIFVFIKGTAQFPFCKFTKKMVAYLDGKGLKYGYFNIFTNNELRERLKDYSNWKTYPQLYIDGKLIGGNDVVQQMEAMGQMDDLLKPSKI